MPFQQTNYAAIEPQGLSGLRGLADNIAKGYALGRAPEQARQADEQNRIAQAMQQMQIDAAPIQAQQKAHEEKRKDSLAQSIIDYRKAGGGKTAQPTLEEKNKSALDLYKKKESYKIVQNVDDAAIDSRKTIRLANELKKIIKNNPDSTGWLASKKHSAGFGSTDTGKVAEKAIVLQAQLMKLMSKLGGVGIAKIVGRGKVDIGNSNKSNIGVADSIIEDVKSTYKELRAKNKKHGGETLADLYKEAKPEVFQQKFKNKDDAVAYAKTLSPEQRKVFISQLSRGG